MLEPAGDISAEQRAQVRHRIARGTAEQKPWNRSEMRFATQVESELRQRLAQFQSGLRRTLPLPPAAEVGLGQPSCGHVMLDAEVGQIQAAGVDGAGPREQVRHFLAQNLLPV